jgi:hypothetical protein
MESPSLAKAPTLKSPNITYTNPNKAQIHSAAYTLTQHTFPQKFI